MTITFTIVIICTILSVYPYVFHLVPAHWTWQSLTAAFEASFTGKAVLISLSMVHEGDGFWDSPTPANINPLTLFYKGFSCVCGNKKENYQITNIIWQIFYSRSLLWNMSGSALCLLSPSRKYDMLWDLQRKSLPVSSDHSQNFIYLVSGKEWRRSSDSSHSGHSLFQQFSSQRRPCVRALD